MHLIGIYSVHVLIMKVPAIDLTLPCRAVGCSCMCDVTVTSHVVGCSCMCDVIVTSHAVGCSCMCDVIVTSHTLYLYPGYCISLMVYTSCTRGAGDCFRMGVLWTGGRSGAPPPPEILTFQEMHSEPFWTNFRYIHHLCTVKRDQFSIYMYVSYVHVYTCS